MSINFIAGFIKHIGIYITLCFCFIKIVDYRNIRFSKFLYLTIITILISFLQYYVQEQTTKFYRLFIVYFAYSLILGKLTNTNFSRSILTTLLSIAISNTLFMTSGFIITGTITLLYKHNANFETPYVVLAISLLTFTMAYILFSFRRLKHGIPFAKKQKGNEYFDIMLLIVIMLILFTYFFIGNLTALSAKFLIISLLFFGIISSFIIYKAFILYQKQKLQTQALKDYEQELVETKQKLSTALEEKQKLVKSNHEFYHRQEAINKKLDDLIANQKILTNSEFSEDLTYISDRLNTLSNEYVEKTKMLPKLNKTNIQEIDDMLSYMQSECNKNNIELILKIECDINHIIENHITKSQLETLLGDLIQNAIIAINHCNNEFKSIMVVFGIKKDNYEICILDSGIPFETTTLVNLGLQPASTHLDEGGTGIGFITTFETINSCNASFIINEITNSNYTKSLEIKFDNKNEYVIISKRIKEINEVNNSNREIILRG